MSVQPMYDLCSALKSRKLDLSFLRSGCSRAGATGHQILPKRTNVVVFHLKREMLAAIFSTLDAHCVSVESHPDTFPDITL